MNESVNQTNFRPHFFLMLICSVHLYFSYDKNSVSVLEKIALKFYPNVCYNLSSLRVNYECKMEISSCPKSNRLSLHTIPLGAGCEPISISSNQKLCPNI